MARSARGGRKQEGGRRQEGGEGRRREEEEEEDGATRVLYSKRVPNQGRVGNKSNIFN